MTKSNDAVSTAPLSWVEVDLGAIVHNFRLVKSLVSPSTRVFAVVKADAYGHGAVPVAKALVKAGADRLCVARVEEALELRAAGVASPIQVFAPPLDGQAESLVRAGCIAVVCAREHVEALAGRARALRQQVAIHVKVDVGMGRLGIAPTDTLEFLRMLMRYPELQVEGIMSHLPCADTPPADITKQHIATFDQVRAEVLASGFNVPMFHLANSAATMDFPEAHFDAVRPGIILYGQYPSADVQRRLPLRPAMTLKSRIVYLKDVPPGQGLSYGHTYITKQPSRIATIPLGYADGYPRHASNRTVMHVRGVPARVVGRVCMDLTLLDVTHIPETQLGDEVVAFGKGAQSFLPVEIVANAIGTIGYELTTRIGKRLPRYYVDEASPALNRP
ncbi:MAG: alanine racemase [Candidatus Hydrogenedentota bacterium]|uniref:Alanine racemase n=1 Tax=Sumerlaea chitinivorans TaxID=2250252 RepID=A0A2Z4Y2Z0_SUMC1|nr:Alanine racemase [Candidatus Sumerlaea chitinivorans]MCX7964932.1 alanine racemase [Candidatus Sumerlaea chitinivorans]RMH29412.1 MAG: alanine racemase [Candidatus Hydrogenedentota bacterium]GIX44480.1 MAG: alanine racemase [Candidatus Sumerlaea sp.]